MLQGQKLKDYSDHNNCVPDAHGLTYDRAYRQCLLLEEYDHKIVYIKGTDNIVADAVRCLNYDMDLNTLNINVHVNTKVFAKLFNTYVGATLGSKPFQTIDAFIGSMMQEGNHLVQHQLRYLFTNNSTTDEDVYPPTISEIARAQASHQLFSKNFEDKKFKNKDNKMRPKVMNNIRVFSPTKTKDQLCLMQQYRTRLQSGITIIFNIHIRTGWERLVQLSFIGKACEA